MRILCTYPGSPKNLQRIHRPWTHPKVPFNLLSYMNTAMQNKVNARDSCYENVPQCMKYSMELRERQLKKDWRRLYIEIVCHKLNTNYSWLGNNGAKYVGTPRSKLYQQAFCRRQKSAALYAFLLNNVERRPTVLRRSRFCYNYAELRAEVQVDEISETLTGTAGQPPGRGRVSEQ